MPLFAVLRYVEGRLITWKKKPGTSTSYVQTIFSCF